MFLLNVGNQWNLATQVEEIRGAILLSAQNSNARFTRKAGPELTRVLIDPQLYLSGLDRSTCRKTCGNLATHPWFRVPGLPEFDSGSYNVREWKKEVEEITASRWPGRPPEGDDAMEACRAAIECQIGFGCTHIILPAPLIQEREDEGGTLANWLDLGLAVSAELEVGQPLLATVAVSEGTLIDDVFRRTGFLDALVDHVTARDGLAGVYIVIAQTGATVHPFQTSIQVLRAYLHLSKAFREGGMDSVFVNFADVFGFICAAAGATDIASGPSQSLRRLSINAFRDDGGGIAVPHFYSHRVIGEFASEADLNRIFAARLLRRVVDETPYSQDLMDAFNAGRSAADLPPWAESQNNLTAAKTHFVCRLALEGAKFRKLTQPKRETVVRDWLEDAEAGMLYLTKRLGASTIGRYAPAGTWRELLDGSL